MQRLLLYKWLRRSLWVGVVMVVGVLVSCRPRAIFHVYQPIEEQTWSRKDTLRFDLPCIQDSSLWQAYVAVRCTNRLKYQDLWVVVEQRTNLARRDTVHFILTDLEGEWIEASSVFHSAELPATTLRLDTPGAQLLVYHVMSPYIVGGISDVGVRIASASSLQTIASGINSQ